jgi:hypothetical protein
MTRPAFFVFGASYMCLAAVVSEAAGPTGAREMRAIFGSPSEYHCSGTERA